MKRTLETFVGIVIGMLLFHYIWPQPTCAQSTTVISVRDIFHGIGPYTLSHSMDKASEQVFINGSIGEPGPDYTLLDKTLTLARVKDDNTAVIQVFYRSTQ